MVLSNWSRGTVLCALILGQACAPNDSALTSSAPEAALELEPCRFAAFDRMLEGMPEEAEPSVGPEAGEARCGRLEVWENRAVASGRRIEINVIVLPATGDDRAPDPVFLFAGGPGTAVSNWGWVPASLAGLRERRDIVLVDQRGTGRSHPLACAAQGVDDVQELFDPMLSGEYVDDCRARLESIADLEHYTTVDHVEDVDQVRRALGYDQVNLWGGSYGTRPVLVFARRHPEAVRTATVKGVDHTSFQYPLHHASAGQAALDGVFEACAGDAACRAAFPDPKGDLAKLMARFDDGPVPVEIDHPDRAERVTIELYDEVLAERFRSLMYRASNSVRIPRMVRDAVASGDLEELAESVLDYQLGFRDGVDWFAGMWMSVTCSEDVHLIDDDEVAEATRGTVFGDYRVRTHRAACERWPRAELPAGFYEHVRSEAPFLLIAGELDPVTPSWATREAADHLPNGLYIEVREGHSSTDSKCAWGVVTAFVEAGSADGLGVRCLEAVELPPWDLG